MAFRRLSTLFILLVLWGCSTAPRHAPVPAMVAPTTETANPDRELLARQLFEKHALAEALVQWKILRTIEPENPKYLNQVSALQKIINEEAERHLAIGLKNLRSGAYNTARLLFLKVLALDPKRRDALTYLREIDEREARTKRVRGMPDTLSAAGAMAAFASGFAKEGVPDQIALKDREQSTFSPAQQKNSSGTWCGAGEESMCTATRPLIPIGKDSSGAP